MTCTWLPSVRRALRQRLGLCAPRVCPLIAVIVVLVTPCRSRALVLNGPECPTAAEHGINFKECAAWAPALLASIPADALVAYFAGPITKEPGVGGAWSAVAAAGVLANHAQQAGILTGLTDCARQWIDTFASLPPVVEHPHALILMDIRADALASGGHKLGALQAALVIQTDGANDRIEQQIRHLLSSYTNETETRLSTDLVHATPQYTIQDRRLPEWATISWGRLGDAYVVSIGEGAFDRMRLATDHPSEALGSDPWFNSALDQIGGERMSGGLYARFQGIDRVGEESLDDKIERVRSALGLNDVERAVWTIGRKDRAVELTAVTRRGGDDEVVSLAGGEFPRVGQSWILPDEASGYTVIDADPSTVLQRVSEAYLATRSPTKQARTREFWRMVQSKAGVSIERDIVSQLGSPLVIHNYPRHFLNLPLLWTILIRIDGDATVLRERIDTLLALGRDEIPPESVVQLRRAEDGIWYIHFGLSGPAVAVTDRWVVISYSPVAVRQIASTLSTPKTARQDAE